MKYKYVTFVLRSNKKWSEKKIVDYINWFTAFSAEEEMYLDDVLEEDKKRRRAK